MSIYLGKRKTATTTPQRLLGMLSPDKRAAFLEALRGVPQDARLEDAAYVALRKIGMNERQARRMIILARSK